MGLEQFRSENMGTDNKNNPIADKTQQTDLKGRLLVSSSEDPIKPTPQIDLSSFQ